MCIKTKLIKSVIKSNDKTECMMEILDILDKDKTKRNLRNAVVSTAVCLAGWYIYNLMCVPYVMEAPQVVEERVMGFKPPTKEKTEEPVQED